MRPKTAVGKGQRPYSDLASGALGRLEKGGTWRQNWGVGNMNPSPLPVTAVSAASPIVLLQVPEPKTGHSGFLNSPLPILSCLPSSNLLFPALLSPLLTPSFSHLHFTPSLCSVPFPLLPSLPTSTSHPLSPHPFPTLSFPSHSFSAFHLLHSSLISSPPLSSHC